MAGLSDPMKSLKSIVTSLQKSVECPVCLETVKPPFKACVRGHLVCLECSSKLEKCPLCQELFTLENLICVKSILEALPQFCCYSDAGCEEIVGSGNDHEMFCGYRPIACPVCSLKSTANKFLEHYRTKHPTWLVIENIREDIFWEFEPTTKVHEFIPVSLFDNLFWLHEIIDVDEKQFKIFFKATPIGKLNHNYYARVTFARGKFLYVYTLKASVLSSWESMFYGNGDDTSDEMKSSDEQYCMTIPQSELSRFIDDDGKLWYKYFFFRE